MAGSNLSKSNFIAPISDSSTSAAGPISSVSSRSSISYVEPYIPLSVLTSTSPLPPTFPLIQSAMAPLAPRLPPLPSEEATSHKNPPSASDLNIAQSRPLAPTDSISNPKCDPVQSTAAASSSDNLPSPMPLLAHSKNWIGRSKSDKAQHFTDRPSLGSKPKLPTVVQKNMPVDEEAKSISTRKPMPPPRPPSLSFLPPTLSILPPTPPVTPGPEKEPPPPPPMPSSPIASNNHCSFPSPPPLPKSPLPFTSASRRSPSPQAAGSDWKEDLPTNELFRSQRQKVGTSTIVSSAVRDWNGRNSSQGVERKEETKKKWDSEKEKNRGSSVVEKLNDTNKDGDREKPRQ